MNLSGKISAIFTTKAKRLPGPVNVEDIRNFVVTHLAKSLSISPESLDPARPFNELGFDSMQAVQFSADLEDWMKLKLSPTIMWEFPNVMELSDQLAVEAGLSVGTSQDQKPVSVSTSAST